MKKEKNSTSTESPLDTQAREVVERLSRGDSQTAARQQAVIDAKRRCATGPQGEPLYPEIKNRVADIRRASEEAAPWLSRLDSVDWSLVNDDNWPYAPAIFGEQIAIIRQNSAAAENITARIRDFENLTFEQISDVFRLESVVDTIRNCFLPRTQARNIRQATQKLKQLLADLGPRLGIQAPTAPLAEIIKPASERPKVIRNIEENEAAG